MATALNDRGQAAVEAIASLGLVTLLIGGGLTVSYVSFARTWLDRNAYEASICLATDLPTSTCESRFRESVSKVLAFGTLAAVTSLRLPREVGLSGRWSLNDDVELKFDDRRRLPLESSQ